MALMPLSTASSAEAPAGSSVTAFSRSFEQLCIAYDLVSMSKHDSNGQRDSHKIRSSADLSSHMYMPPPRPASPVGCTRFSSIPSKLRHRLQPRQKSRWTYSYRLYLEVAYGTPPRLPNIRTVTSFTSDATHANPHRR